MSLCCVAQVCRFLPTLIDNAFGASFNIAGLGGLINAGKTGLKAAMSHSPETKDADGKLREKCTAPASPFARVSPFSPACRQAAGKLQFLAELQSGEAATSVSGAFPLSGPGPWRGSLLRVESGGVVRWSSGVTNWALREEREGHLAWRFYGTPAFSRMTCAFPHLFATSRKGH